MDVNDISPNDVLDCVHLACPMPVFKTANRVKDLLPGQVLEVQADDQGILKDLPAWCRQTGNEFLGSREEGSEYRLYVRKKL
jgi:TusA-related sulfurtransferase